MGDKLNSYQYEYLIHMFISQFLEILTHMWVFGSGKFFNMYIVLLSIFFFNFHHWRLKFLSRKWDTVVGIVTKWFTNDT